MTQRNEIRGFKAGRFFSKDGSADIRISRSDDCVTVEVADIDADSLYKFDIPFEANNEDDVSFTFMSLKEQRESEEEF